MTSDVSASDSSASESDGHPLDKYISNRHDSDDTHPPSSKLETHHHSDVSQEKTTTATKRNAASIPDDDDDDDRIQKNKKIKMNTQETTSMHEKNNVPDDGAAMVGHRVDDVDIDQVIILHNKDTINKDANFHMQQTYRTEPIGVTVLQEGEIQNDNTEMIRLLRVPRYFDDDFEGGGVRCFVCGGTGHMAKDCTSVSIRACFVCAEYGHDSKDCPHSVCWKCNRHGHQARDCTGIDAWTATEKKDDKNKKKKKKGRKESESQDDDESDIGPGKVEPVCLRCGSRGCPCAGHGDYARAQGRCTMTSYSRSDLKLVECYHCGKRGHTGCAEIEEELPRPTCYNCGDGGHVAADCYREPTRMVKSEKSLDEQQYREQQRQQRRRYDDNRGDCRDDRNKKPMGGWNTNHGSVFSRLDGGNGRGWRDDKGDRGQRGGGFSKTSSSRSREYDDRDDWRQGWRQGKKKKR